jgi:threonine aldolase
MRSFASDNYAGVHPEIMDAMFKANVGDMPSYGEDPVSGRAVDLFKKHFGDQAQIYFIATGTATNTLILKHITRSWNSVICSTYGHIHVDECGSPEAVAGIKLITARTANGKLTPDAVVEQMYAKGFVHHSQPAVVSFAQCTELGTVYTVQEIKDICDAAHNEGLLVHMDGARLTNAAAALGTSFKEMTVDAGVDVLSFGGTKNGCMCAEAAVFLKPGLGDDFRFVRKQGMQLISKMRFIGAQFERFLADDELWRQNALQANSMAALLAEKAAQVDGVKISGPVEANGVFAFIPEDCIAPLQEKCPFYIWDELTGEVRWMTSFMTKEQDIDDFVAALKETLSNRK